MASEFYRKSECMGGYLHKFTISCQYSEGVEEICERCGQVEFFPVFEGSIDNENYMDYHLKEVLSPNHPLYYHEYQYIKDLHDLFE